IIDLYILFAVFTAVIQVGYMAVVGSFPFNSFLSGVLSCVGTAVLAVSLRIQVNKDNKEFKVKYAVMEKRRTCSNFDSKLRWDCRRRRIIRGFTCYWII
ncbi:Defender against death protein, partial [Perilla frutescens var. hirtella]